MEFLGETLKCACVAGVMAVETLGRILKMAYGLHVAPMTRSYDSLHSQPQNWPYMAHSHATMCGVWEDVVLKSALCSFSGCCGRWSTVVWEYDVEVQFPLVFAHAV